MIYVVFNKPTGHLLAPINLYLVAMIRKVIPLILL